MHELALTQNLMETLAASARQQGISRINLVHLVVGRMSGALPGALEFCFSALKRGDLLGGARLEIEEREIQAQCQACGKSFIVEDYCFLCPACSAGEVKIVSGRELYIDYYDGE
ncbi:MAG: hydrogenase maturation nickel metallochaperone HypA [Firmicutes bacterium]|nr:hydrogenase maturation nickel metallochaperone HypA [Bacillota bacterium]